MKTMVDAELHDGGSTSFTLVFLLWASSARSRRHGIIGRGVVGVANVPMIFVVREAACLMPAISPLAGMNSRAAGPRSHRSRIGPYEVVSNRDGIIEAAD